MRIAVPVFGELDFSKAPEHNEIITGGITMRWKHLPLLVMLYVLLSSTQAAPGKTAGSRLHESYRQLVEADALLSSGQTNGVAVIYRNAVHNLEYLQRQYPGWQREVVGARLAYARNRLALIDGKDFAGMEKEPDKPGKHAKGSSRMEKELAWREKLARAQEDARAIRRENAELKSRLRALEMMPAISFEIPQSAHLRLSKFFIDEAARLYAEETADSAIALLEAGAELLPHDLDIGLELGVRYCRAGRFEAASRLLRDVISRQPDNVTARLALGAAWMGLGNPGAARVEIEAALRADSRNADAHYNMAHILIMLPNGDAGVARRHYYQSVSLGGAPDRELEMLIQQAILRQDVRGR